MKSIVLAGNGTTAEILYEYVKQDSRYNVVAVIADDEYVKDQNFLDVPCLKLSALECHYHNSDVAVVIAMGYDDLNRSRQSMFDRIKHIGYKIETYIHPDAKVYTSNQIGEGSVVLPGAVLEPYSKLGKNSMIWCNSTVAHHADIGDHCWLASGCVISGSAVVGDNTFIGVNSTIVNEVEVGKLNLVGAGALISKCTKANTVHLSRSGEQFRFSAEEYIKFFGV
ncbi:acetyltransferase [Enterovibrio makurazakiensis]|uniref:acetyltransferase n=1 Tax=Enterovibrio makurazakiensis TaxID=2910232 RepID=UPI003D210A43